MHVAQPLGAGHEPNRLCVGELLGLQPAGVGDLMTQDQRENPRSEERPLAGRLRLDAGLNLVQETGAEPHLLAAPLRQNVIGLDDLQLQITNDLTPCLEVGLLRGRFRFRHALPVAGDAGLANRREDRADEVVADLRGAELAGSPTPNAGEALPSPFYVSNDLDVPSGQKATEHGVGDSAVPNHRADLKSQVADDARVVHGFRCGSPLAECDQALCAIGLNPGLDQLLGGRFVEVHLGEFLERLRLGAGHPRALHDLVHGRSLQIHGRR